MSKKDDTPIPRNIYPDVATPVRDNPYKKKRLANTKEHTNSNEDESCETYDSYLTPVPVKTDSNTDNTAVPVSDVRTEDVADDPTKWDSIPLYDDSAGFGFVPVKQSYTQTEITAREETRVKSVSDLADRLYRYHKACLALIRANAPKWFPLIYIRQELFAEKIANLAFHIKMSSAPTHIMTANAIKTHFGLENDE